MIFTHNYINEKLSFSENDYLWRYIDVIKLADFLKSKSFKLISLSKFADPLEAFSLHEIGELETWTKHRDFSHLPEGLQKTLQENAKIAFEETKVLQDIAQERQKRQYASCWFFGNRESISMWDIYGTEKGVAIKVKAQVLFDHLRSLCPSIRNKVFKELFYGHIEYLALSPFDVNYPERERIYPSFKKDQAYEHENEFRFVSSVSEDLGEIPKFLPLCIRDIIEDFSIVANPRMDDWEFDQLGDLIQKYEPNVKIQKSSIRLAPFIS